MKGLLPLGNSGPPLLDAAFLPVPLAWLGDLGGAQHAMRIGGMRAPGIWSRFIDRCELFDLSSLPSMEPTFAAYLINHISKLDETGRRSVGFDEASLDRLMSVAS
jgi:hypothetical protein